jgi:hypothetical protein
MADQFTPVPGSEIAHIVPLSKDTHWVYLKNGTTLLWTPQNGTIHHVGQMPTYDKLTRESAKHPKPAP